MHRGIGLGLHPTQLSYNPPFCVIDITTTTVDFNLLLVITSPSFSIFLDTPMTDKTIIKTITKLLPTFYFSWVVEKWSSFGRLLKVLYMKCPNPNPT